MAISQCLKRLFGELTGLLFQVKAPIQIPAVYLIILFALPVFFVIFSSFLSTTARAATPTIVIYRVGSSNQVVEASISRAIEAKGFPVILVQGETIVEKHIEKISVINRGPAKVFVAFQFVPSNKVQKLTIIKTVPKKGNGFFLTINEVPAKFTEESHRLAYTIADTFAVKVKQMPLFPLLGVNMPGLFLRLEGKENDVDNFASKLGTSLEKYIKKERKL